MKKLTLPICALALMLAGPVAAEDKSNPLGNLLQGLAQGNKQAVSKKEELALINDMIKMIEEFEAMLDKKKRELRAKKDTLVR